eukprot:CAMPEP_0201570868 /NCGR_PEP_ID=MMETSP0190_2-20130828/13314_1 /ASSEMBLY_ACC=CAM_ASM_000263 /TAXON_ID=37353 /ORGANISM="Rosalina sp." /LENGTH=270 /DNA_ID=CAMNT_0047994871 /DNA_START=31 /DNA_END=843 /DNA_ORIENTATION=-
MSPLQHSIIGFLSLITFISTINAQTPITDWEDGRSTYYTTWEQGACNYGTISADTFPFNNIAAPNEAFYNKSLACGGCFEIMCVGPWDQTYCPGSAGCKTPNASVIIEVTDECPVQGNEQWCSGDITHFDLSQHAFDLIADNTCGVIKQKWRQVTCNYGTGKNIIVLNHNGINQWYFGITIESVDYYGQVSNVEIKDASSSTWSAGQRQDYNVFLWQATGNGLQTPISVRVTDSHGNMVVGNNIVTSFTGGAKFDLGTNFYNISSRYGKK